MISSEVAKAFLEDAIIHSIHIDQSGTDDLLILVVNEDIDDISLYLSRLKRKIMRRYPAYYFEITYVALEELGDYIIPSDTRIMHK
ncbi:hypothetical protein PAAL109150_20640 [Paenibacillus alkaliterrae]